MKVIIINVAGTSFIAFHFTAMTKTNKFNGGDFLQVCTSLWEMLIVIITMVGVFQESVHSL